MTGLRELSADCAECEHREPIRNMCEVGGELVCIICREEMPHACAHCGEMCASQEDEVCDACEEQRGHADEAHERDHGPGRV